MESTGPSTDKWLIREVDRSKHYYEKGPNYIVMAQVAYVIPNSMAIKTQDLSNMVFFADTGSVTFNPGRETLSLDTKTISYLNTAFQDAAECIVEKIHESLALCTSDSEVYKCYTTAVKALPYTLTRQVKALPLTSKHFQALVSEGRANNLYVTPSTSFYGLTNNTLKVMYKSGYRKLFKECNEYAICASELFSLDHVIVDVKTNFTRSLQELYASTPVFLWRCQSTKHIEEAVQKAKDYITALGCTYKLASDILPEGFAKSTGISRKGLYVSHVSRDNISKSKLLSADKITEGTYLYLKLSNTVPILADSNFTFNQYMMAYRILRNITKDTPLIYGVAKKYQSYVDSLSNWVDFESYIKDKIKKNYVLSRN